MNDWMLVSAYVQGDEGAFENLVAKYFRMVYTVAARQLGDQHLAEEVAQSVFIILARKAGQLSANVSVCGWLLQTTRYVSRDAMKMRRRRHQNEQEFASALELNPPSKPERNAMEALLDEALVALPAAEQAAVMAHFLEGKNFREVGELLAISEDAAQKRVSRSLVKLRSYLVKRGAKVPLSALAGLLTAQFAHEAAAQTLQPAIQAAHAAAQGKAAAGKALTLADHATRLFQWRSAISLGLKLGLSALLLLGGAWAVWEWRTPHPVFQVSDPRIENLGKAWSQMVVRIDGLSRSVAGISPNDPRFQTVLTEINTAAEDAGRIGQELGLLLIPPQDRERVAEFLTIEVGETLNLDQSEKNAVFALVRGRLTRGATLTDAMKAMAADIPAIAVQIKALLNPDQRQRFDLIYHPDASAFFVYLKSATVGK